MLLVLARLRIPGAIAVAAIGCAWACLPDLEIGAAAGGAPSYCGDGYIDVDAGETCDPGDGGSAVGCASCAVACDGGFVDESSNHCYFAVGLTTSSADAIKECAAQGAHVARFVNEAELRFVAPKAPTSEIWVSLAEQRQLGTPIAYLPFDPTIEPGWRSTCGGCFAHNAPDAGARIDPVPLADGGTVGGECVFAAQDPKVPWFQSPCGSTQAYPIARETICEREPPGSRATFCVGEAPCFTTAATQATKRYLIVTAPQSATDAAQACATFGGKPVVVTTREEREQIAAEIAAQHVTSQVKELWIGLALGSDGAWHWDGDDDAGIAPNALWAIGEPADAGPGARAYLRIDPGAVDSELAHAGAAGETRTVVCQL